MSGQHTRSEVMRAFVPASPLARHLGIELRSLGGGQAKLAMPYDERLATMGDVVHGGAISALIDTAGMAAAWADEEVPQSLLGSTVNLHVDFLEAARGAELIASATAVRRGRTLCFCDVAVHTPDGRLVAKGSMVHRYG